MAKRQKEWARRKRQELLDLYGEVCAECGDTSCLTFDCVVPMGSEHHGLDTARRMTFYWRQHAAGNLQVLCQSCNSSKGGRRQAR